MSSDDDSFRPSEDAAAFESAAESLPPEDPATAIEILYESGPAVVVWKPSGLSTQAPPIAVDTLEVRMRRWVQRKRGTTGKVYLGLPHRLDRAVSGAVVFALHVRAARRLSEQFEQRTVRKVYLAGVEGEWSESLTLEGSWVDHIRKVPDEARAERIPPTFPDAREARLRYRRVWSEGKRHWLEIELETGRMHQIRLQCACRGLPLLGDVLYGSQTILGDATLEPSARPIALHAGTLGFQHPMTREPVVVEAPLPDAWRSLPGADRLGRAFHAPAGA